MTSNLKRLRALLRPLPVMHSTDDREVLTLWCDQKDPGDEWARSVASVNQNPNVARWLTQGPAAATAVADELERLRIESAELRQSVKNYIHSERQLLAENQKIGAALNAAGWAWKVDDEGDIVETLAERVSRALASIPPVGVPTVPAPDTQRRKAAPQ